MVVCCDKPLLTPFCPQCGKANSDPLLELVAYLRSKADNFGAQAQGREERADQRAENTDHPNRRSDAGQLRKTAATYREKEQQFTAWAELLMALAKKQAAGR